MPIGCSWIFHHLLTLFLVREPITEYGRVFIERQVKYEEPEWLRTVQLNRVDIDGNPNHPLNGGITGLADVHCLGSMSNHATGGRKNAFGKIWDFTSCQALLDPRSSSDVSVGYCIVLEALRDIKKDEQILSNYDPTAAIGLDIPFANVSLGQFIRVCSKSLLPERVFSFF